MFQQEGSAGNNLSRLTAVFNDSTFFIFDSRGESQEPDYKIVFMKLVKMKCPLTYCLTWANVLVYTSVLGERLMLLAFTWNANLVRTKSRG